MYCLIDESSIDKNGTVNKYDKKYSTLLNMAKQYVSEHGLHVHKTVTYLDDDGNVKRILIFPKSWGRPFFEIIKVDKVQH